MPRPIPKMDDEDPLILPPSPHLLMDESAKGDTCPQAVVITTVAAGVSDDLTALKSSTPNSIVTTGVPSPSPIAPILTRARLSATLPSNKQEEGNTTRPSRKSKETATAKITQDSKASERPKNPSSQGMKRRPITADYKSTAKCTSTSSKSKKKKKKKHQKNTDGE